MLLSSCAAIALAPALAQAQETKAVAFSIPAQDLGASLNQFARQSEHQIVFSTNIAMGRKAPALQGELAPEDALGILLAGTDLTWKREGDAYMITRANAPQSGSAAGGGAEVEALIVTAQKREEDIQDVPIAISAFTQEDLTRSQVAGGPDLMTQVPNMTFTKTNFSSYSIQLRGIGTQAISATVDPAVAVAFNNTPFVRNRFFEQEFYDLQRVEVLRGPQGTLYGRNATAGVVNIISAKPVFHYEARLSGDAANYNSTRLEGMVNIPLAEDLVALRIAGAWTKRNGYTTNEITGSPIDGRDLWSTRVSLRFSPVAGIDANLIWEHFEEDDDRLRSGKQLCKKDIVTEVGGVGDIPFSGSYNGPQGTFGQGCKPASLYSPDSFQTPNGFVLPFYHPIAAAGFPRGFDSDPYLSQVQSRDLRVIESTVDPSYEADSDVVELQVNLDLTDNLSLSSETAWARDFIFSTQDYNRFNTRSGAFGHTDGRPGLVDENGFFCDPQIGCADRLVLTDLSTAKSRHFSQEFRLASDYDGPFNFSLGANFLRYDTTEKYYVFINSATLWAATKFNTSLSQPYVVGESDNRECVFDYPQEVPLATFGGVNVTGGLNCIYIETNSIHNLEDTGHNYFLSKNPYKLLSYAAFGEVYYNVTDALKVTAGLRWTVDKKQAPIIPSWILAEGVGYPTLEVVDQEWREPTGRLTIDWKPNLSFTDETLLYASYARGYKAGGANPPPAAVVINRPTDNGVPPASATHPRTFDAEFVNAFELGAKNTMFDGRVTLNTAAFYYDYQAYQLSQIVDRTAITRNFDADVWGIEIEADWRPLENLRLGAKLGYEDTRVADGMKAVDIMDRTNGGQPDENGVSWILIKPFPVYPSNCIVPDYVVVYQDTGEPAPTWHIPGSIESGNADGACERAYVRGVDPVTNLPYVENPTVGTFNSPPYPGYIGFNPFTAPNFGEGIDKDLAGNELPNAPHFTTTLTADYTIPLPNDWLATLHTDLYYQSEAWTRIFNTEGYDKLKAYTNVNLAAIFTNDDAGWKVMAYVKNVFDRDSITGAFLNSDDTALTTNVFVTEPRLYGLRVTKEWNGGPLLGSFGAKGQGPHPFTVEIGGQIDRIDAPADGVRPSFADAFAPEIDVFPTEQDSDLDWGDGRQVKLSWRPDNSPWVVSAGVRFGKTNETSNARLTAETDRVCGFSGYLDKYCEIFAEDPLAFAQKTNWGDRKSHIKEEYDLVDFAVGRDLGIGGLTQSSISLGLRYAKFEAKNIGRSIGSPDWYIPEGFKYPGGISTQTIYEADLTVDREFKGVGPVFEWDAAATLFGGPDNHLDAEVNVAAGALFGKQRSSLIGTETASYYEFTGILVIQRRTDDQGGHAPFNVVETPISMSSESDGTVPVLDLSAGLSWVIGGVKAGAGYRWERYYDAIGAVSSDDTYDRTIEGPYFKVSVGFGG
ncbi:MAG TPA: TonB-dependent receptor [Caulobacteraceae bacterium]